MIPVIQSYRKAGLFQIYGILFLAALFVCITLTAPQLNNTDGYIQINQMQQILSGKQFILYENLFSSADPLMDVYFSNHNDIMGNSLFLTFLSIPVYILYIGAGDLLRFFIILIWALIPMIIGYILATSNHDSLSRWKPAAPLLFAIAIILFFINYFLYYPFPYSPVHERTAVAALISVNGLLFSFFFIVMVAFFHSLLKDLKFGIFSACAVLCCSSYLYWMADGKDHILSSLLVCLILLCYLHYVRDGSFSSGACAFILIGFLAWDRSELAFAIACSLGFVHYFFLFFDRRSNRDQGNQRIGFLLPLLILIGCIPFVANNIVVTGNPIVPPDHYYAYFEQNPAVTKECTSALYTSHPAGMSAPLSLVSPADLIYGNIAPKPQWIHSLPEDLFGSLFFPKRLAVGFFAMCPLAIPGILMGFFLFLSGQAERYEKRVVILCYVISLAVILVYIRSWHGFNLSVGIGPDIRNLSPLYLVLSVPALIVFQKIQVLSVTKTIPLGMILPCVVFFILVIASMPLLSVGSSLHEILRFFSWGALWCGGAATIVLYLYGIQKRRLYGYCACFLIAGILVFPLLSQFVLCIVASVTGFSGFPFWIPVIEWLISSFFSVQ